MPSSSESDTNPKMNVQTHHKPRRKKSSRRQSAEKKRESSADPGSWGELNLFEELREMIYTEVASVISQNESRPQYLLSLFSELQGMTSDLMRQRTLLALQEIAQTKLKRDHDAQDPSREARLRQHTSALERQKQKQKHCGRSSQRGGSLKDDKFHYMETAVTTSSLSTPANDVGKPPFSRDSLGDTIVHLDKPMGSKLASAALLGKDYDSGGDESDNEASDNKNDNNDDDSTPQNLKERDDDLACKMTQMGIDKDDNLEEGEREADSSVHIQPAPATPCPSPEKLIHQEVLQIMQDNPGLTVDHCQTKCDALFDLAAGHDKEMTDHLCGMECSHQINHGMRPQAISKRRQLGLCSQMST